MPKSLIFIRMLPLNVTLSRSFLLPLMDSLSTFKWFVSFQIEYGRKNIDGANQMVNDKLNSLVAWRSNGPNQERNHEAEVRRRTSQIRSEITELKCKQTSTFKSGPSLYLGH